VPASTWAPIGDRTSRESPQPTSLGSNNAPTPTVFRLCVQVDQVANRTLKARSTSGLGTVRGETPPREWPWRTRLSETAPRERPRRTRLTVVCWLRWQVEVQWLASGESVKQPLQLPGRRRWRPRPPAAL